MSPIRTAADPCRPRFGLGWLPDPLAWAPWESIGGGRFDDPQRRFRVLYAASQRRGAFIETLARFRPSLEFLARAAEVTGSEESLPVFTIPNTWHLTRGVGRIRVLLGQRWLDLHAPETREALRSELAGTLLERGLSDLDLSGVTGPTKALTQVIARWAYEHGHTGLAYPSRFDETLTLWAIFEGAAFVTVGVPEPIEPDDADLAATAQLFGLTRECVFPTPAIVTANEATTTGRQAWMENEPAGWAAHPALSTLTIRGALLMEQNRIPPSSTGTQVVFPATEREPERTTSKMLPVLHAGGFSASVDAFAWEPDPAARRMQRWFLSLLGPKEAVKALWARLIKGEIATMSFETFGKARFCALAPEGPRGWRFFTATLRAAAGYHGLLVPESALYPTQRADFLLLPRRLDEAARLHYQFLNRRLDLPLHPSWADWLWERALDTGEAVALESHGVHAYRCSPNPAALADDLRAAVRQGRLHVNDADTPHPLPQ